MLTVTVVLALLLPVESRRRISEKGCNSRLYLFQRSDLRGAVALKSQIENDSGVRQRGIRGEVADSLVFFPSLGSSLQHSMRLCTLQSLQPYLLTADDNVGKHSPHRQIAKGGGEVGRGGDGEEAGGKHTAVRRVALNGKVLRGREMRRGRRGVGGCS